MKKFIACLTVLLICLSMAVPAAALETEFVPSISVKPAPEIVPGVDGEGDPYIALLMEDGEIIDYIDEHCLVITPVAEAKTSTLIPDYAEEMLLDVYAKLTSGEMTIPYDKHNAKLDETNMIVRDLFDATWLCEDHPVMLEPEGVVLQITFDLGVKANENVYCMTYKNSEWNPIVSCTNNGDGTVTCVFEHLCPIEFSVEGESNSSQTGDDVAEKLPLWGLAALVSLLAIVVLTVIYRRDRMKNA